MLKEKNNQIAAFVKHQRQRLKLSQKDLSEKAGVGLRFIRELEQGKEELMMNKVNQVLELFGYRLLPEKGIDPHFVLFNHFNRHVYIFLKDKSTLNGIIIDHESINGEIKNWMFIKSVNAIEFQKKGDKKLITILPHDTIERIENIG